MRPDRRIVLRLADAGSVRVRYGRATIRIRRWGNISASGVDDALVLFKSEALTAEAVCWAFVKDRIEGHSQSFDWDQVELERILCKVTAASREPKFESSDGAEVVAVLQAALEDERRVMAETRQRIRRLTNNFGLASLIGRQRSMLGLAGSYPSPLAEMSKAILGTGSDASFQVKLLSSSRPKVDDLLKLSGFSQQIHALNSQAVLGRGPGVIGFPREIDRRLGQRPFARPDIAPAIVPRHWQSGIVARIKELQPNLTPFFGGLKQVSDSIRDWVDAYKESLPENWRELEEAELDAVVEVMLGSALCLAWAPRLAIVRELLGAETYEQRCQVLEARDAEILDDVEEVLAQIHSAELAPMAAACLEAIATYRDDHPGPAQAYAGAALTSILHDFLGVANFAPVRETFANVHPLHDVELTSFPLYAVGRVWVRVFDRFEEAGEGFNRNLTLHKIGAPHYSRANFIAVMLLMAGLLPELQQLHHRQQGRLLAPAA